jgi:hypothetical protein
LVSPSTTIIASGPQAGFRFLGAFDGFGSAALTRSALALGLRHMLLLPPYFYRDASAEGIEDAFAAILDDAADRSAARHALSYSADVGRRRAGVGGGQPSRALRRDRRGSPQLRAVLSVIGDLPFTPALKAILAAQTGDAGWLRVRAPLRAISDGAALMAKLDSLSRAVAA